ncbi:nuclear transport factor 2 family protein [Fulvivirga sedimenti]|uniref:Nuclear transport factor 2 family protein n=1 Tax=Fulvivirga sedimenti TaxID=2879465 RepID=A0A9X1HQN5_9BACT|nr:nuclear transport factor 2 family protein [Fulvivirga sedimenti]MCA6075014.1 nuclear transport factor 2 family protein [Fulvivirga sedimenti]MCA6076191.1 nuclear transport factor 2 family protein [Fulvivirga sedimenti]MCA6077319.1 nuclear transport factor 2 family protein [Fulvivirga sedimenti]
MKLIKIISILLIVFTVSCQKNADKSEINSIPDDSKTQFDVAEATAIIKKRNKDFEDALKAGDSIAVGDIYTVDSKIIGAYAGRDNLIKEVHELVRDSITDIRFKIINIWGNQNIIVEDAYVEFYHMNGTLVSKGNSLFVWKKESDTWRIFRDVYKPEKIE